MTYGYDTDIALVKYNENGEEIWRTFYNRTGSSPVSYEINPSVAIDNAGDLYLAVLDEIDGLSLVKYRQLPYLCGDLNSDGIVNILDIIILIVYLNFEGPPPDYLEAANVNASSRVDAADIAYLIAYLYAGGDAPYCITEN